MGLDHFVDIATFGGAEGREEFLLIIQCMGCNLVGVIQVFAMQDFHGALGPHHRDLRARPSIVDITA